MNTTNTMKMFCFQCQEANGGRGCTTGGMCGKKADLANLQDALILHLKKAAAFQESAGSANVREFGRFVTEALFMTITNANFDAERFHAQISAARAWAGEEADTDAQDDPTSVLCQILTCENEDLRSLRELLTYGLKGTAAYAHHAAVLGFEDDAIYAFLTESLAILSDDSRCSDPDALTARILQCGQTAVRTMELLDQANTSTFGTPSISQIPIGVGTRPGILISGHDLLDLRDLLEQTKDEGIDIYTHCEMLPAHTYPELRKYPHLYGNYGGAWHRQNVEFASFNGPILMTTNCITPVQESYRNRIFTTGAVGYAGIPHIPERKKGEMKDFSQIIALAKTCPPPTPLEEGTLTTGFGHSQVLALADKVIEAVKSGATKHFVVMAGCDGRHKERAQFTERAQALPKDTVILTAGCAKYRYNKLDLGDIGGIPRVLDAGQCNDSYSLAVIALKLREAFGLEDVNDLPLSFDLGWYEQKAVAVLLALLALGFKNIKLGPTLPAFVSPNVGKVLQENFGLHG